MWPRGGDPGRDRRRIPDHVTAPPRTNGATGEEDGDRAMNTRDRLIGYQHAFDHPVTVWIVVCIAALLAVCPVIIWILDWLGRIPEKQRSELYRRWLSWLIMTPLLVLPILLGALWTILGVG